MRYVLGVLFAVAGFTLTILAGIAIAAICGWLLFGVQRPGGPLVQIVTAFIIGASFFGARLGWNYAGRFTRSKTTLGTASVRPALND